jgi:hypothetical protein
VKQIRFTARILGCVEEFGGGNRLIRTMAHAWLTAPILNAMLGYQRVFDDLPQAVAAANPYSGGGHDATEAGALHLGSRSRPGRAIMRCSISITFKISYLAGPRFSMLVEM